VNSEPANNSHHQSLSLIDQGLAFCGEKRWSEAAACFEALVEQEPENKVAWNNLGNVRDELGDVAGAYQAFQAALTIDPDYLSPKKNLALVAYRQGSAQYATSQLHEALAAFQTAATLGLSQANYDHSYLQLLLETCEHRHVAAHVVTMMNRMNEDESYLPHPYPLLAAIDDPFAHRLAAKRHLARLCNEAGVRIIRSIKTALAHPDGQSKYKRIRVAYISCDWHQHPVPQQLLPSIEVHDRSAFEVIGIATDDRSDITPWRQRIERAFDRFYAFGHLNDNQIAEQLRRMHIDIAIDLSVYMEGGRPLILATRPCPVQVAFLGYAGTSSAPWLDYLIADEVTVPSSHTQFYSERILRLPHTFMPDNNQRPVIKEPRDKAAQRAQQGLPAEGFVFCGFNNPYKITPEMLACWFRLLHVVPSSVLWLQANNDVTQKHIEAAGAAAGLTPQRLVFAKRVDSFDEHLQRYPLADLFLDSFPYNAHVTAADALWADLPVLTLQGASFASRVASSILSALGLQALITTDLAKYEARALELANQPMQLKNLRHQLKQSKAVGAYFNQTRYARLLEQTWMRIATPKPQKLIAFSLWGDNPTYLMGALRNAELAAHLYPDWICRFYCADDLSQAFLNQLQEHTNVQLVLMPSAPDRGGAFWRFFAAAESSVSHVLFRDTDSRLSVREVAAVNEWLRSGKDVHLMRDHPFHWPSIMAGMWGCKGGVLIDWQAQLDGYQPTTEYGSDQDFLANVIYPKIKHQCLIHDAFELSEANLDVRPFPKRRVALEFVGQCFDADNMPNKEYEQALAEAL